MYAPSTLISLLLSFLCFTLFFSFLVSCCFLRCDVSVAVAVAAAAVAESMVCAFALLTNKMRCECVCLMQNLIRYDGMLVQSVSVMKNESYSNALLCLQSNELIHVRSRIRIRFQSTCCGMKRSEKEMKQK